MGNTIVYQLGIEVDEVLATINARIAQLLVEIETTGRYQGATSVPTVETDAADEILNVSAKLHGEVTADGGEDGPVRGFDYHTSQLPGVSSTPTTTTDPYACRLAHQRSGFYAAGRFWLFYSDGVHFAYKSSLDNVDWSAAVEIRALDYAAMYSIFFDGTYVHYACNDHYQIAVGYFGIWYRRGVPNANGTITWSVAEQEALDDALQAMDLNLAIDSNGCAWIGYLDVDQYPTITASTANDGTWVTRAGHPHIFFATGQWWCAVVPMTSGKVAAIVTKQLTTEETIRCYVWDGAAWGDQEVATTSKLRGATGGYLGELCVVGIGDDVHVAFHSDSNDIRHARRTGGAWLAEAIIVPALPTIIATCTPVLSVDGVGLYCFWERGTTIYYKTWTSAAGWSYWPQALLQDTWLAACYNLEAYAARVDGYLCVNYMAGAASPYDIKHVVFLGPFSSWSELLEDGVGVYSYSATSLLPSHTYYFRAIAQNSRGRAYGATLSFGTIGAARSQAVFIA